MPTFERTEIVRQSNEATKEVYATLAADAAELAAIERGGGEVVEIKGRSHRRGCARSARLSGPALCRPVGGRTARTVLADPSREGRKELNAQGKCAALQARGELQARKDDICWCNSK